ncbi:MAG: FmdE family protein [Bacteroidia bacterium]|nr:FmdE family protein [Bacteroidia bacterium]
MKKYIIPLYLLLLATNLWASPLHSKLKHSIIIDTDCNDSDLRAISILLSHPGIIVKAILVSDGKLRREEGMKKIRSLLHRFNADKIQVETGTGRAERFLLSEILQASKEEMTIVCLGPLTNMVRELQGNQKVYKNIEEIIWYNESVNPLHGYNYEYDRTAVDLLFKSGIGIDIISTLNSEFVIFDHGFINQCRKAKTTLGKEFFTICKQSAESEKSVQSEELAAIYMANPELFEMTPSEEKATVHFNKKQNIQAIKEVVTDMITGRYKSGNFIAFYGFPANRELFVYDVRQIMDSAITRYGIDEWKACVMTDEFHGHLGVFSIVGAKMGIYAREYFGIGTDMLEINTYAGSREPLSCMNDGLQVSTGATLGQGSIHLINDTIAKPQAVFTYQNRSIMIKLKSAYLNELKSVIDEGVMNYGLEDEGYWTLIRRASIKYWLKWDREKIFDLVILYIDPANFISYMMRFIP